MRRSASDATGRTAGSGPRSCRWIIQLDADVVHREDLAVGKYR